MKLDILAFGSHPDDVEIGCGGTLKSHSSAGLSCGVIDLTRGELGTRGTPLLRLKEAKKAAKILNLKVRENCAFSDGFFELSKKNLLKIIYFLRLYQPEIVYCNAIYDRHPDHKKGADIVEEASFLSNLIKIKSYYKGKLQDPWKPSYIFHYIQDRFIEPNFVMDISNYFEDKMNSIKAYFSQFYNPASKEPTSYISRPEFLTNIERRASLLGKRIGVKYAEGFTSAKTLGLANLNSLIKNKT